jgi:hypothetical protein
MNVALCTLFGSQRHIHDNPERRAPQLQNEVDEGLGAGVVS